MIKGDGKNQRHQEQEHEDVLVIGADNQEEKEADDQNQELRGDDVRENRAYEKAVFTLEKRHAAWAVMADVEWLRDDRGRAAGWAPQFQTPPQDCLDLFKIYFQGLHSSKKIFTQRRKDRKGAKARPNHLTRLCVFAIFAPLREILSSFETAYCTLVQIT